MKERLSGRSLRLFRITKKIGEFQLRDISLEVFPEEYFVILGPTGAGKTVLLEVIAGMHAPDAGEIWLGEENITAWPPEKRRFGFVYQDYALFPHINVRENIVFGLKNKKLPPGEIKRELEAVASLLGIAHLLRRLPYTLSGGEQQRVALARALIMKPRVLLLDEPLSALDPCTKETLQQELKRLHRFTGTLIVHVTHDFEEALYLGDRIGVLMGGGLLQVGSPEEIFTRPRTAAVARFVGVENIYYSDIILRGGRKYVTLGGALLQVETQLTGRAGFSVRPEHILVSSLPRPGNCLPGKVLAVYPRGLLTRVIIDAGERLVALVVAREDKGCSLSPGSTVYCTIPPAAINVFPHY
ncbi:MAG: molybdate transport system ATP-binding protein [Moorella sp. (in: firmicutes)]|uniref:ABC transporter ATP-binding protein n=1 Tax=unclassified Neomoorella TaxID=2676739 RepID=UPI0010FFAA84|nr:MULTISPECIES: ABC transporter ATP-binding protein [unclassified Moorella (in: firmicutes)]MDK2817049.1 molybdate transport system ATP-binding protein [Moorella sp. (in: firmicutes)]MDK2895674.1 molybdate transport system ATP-binding protein [Moorella sp. (in: firmicutes)]GEA13792.1 molybdenum ABC transporter ATP-binding protein [Moorella sp. E308F]GEA18843.1 molybdenum ABC transporter ATP-binding protein [Moorella sp. E306M]